MVDWYSLKNLCIAEVANQLAQERLPPTHNSDPPDVRLKRWEALAEQERDNAVEKIKAMNGLELLGLISEVAGYHLSS